MDKVQYGQFHLEVLKKLHSMKSSKSLVELASADRPTCDEIECLNLESSKQLNNIEDESPNEIDIYCKEGPPMNNLSAIEIDFDDGTPSDVKHKLLKILQRNKELEDALRIKELAMQKLILKNQELENELKRKEVIRLAQLELLALRNVELEQELRQQSPKLAEF
jgi:hypothetical protein